MNDREMDDVLRATRTTDAPPPETLRQIASRIQGSLRPVRPLPAAWILTAGLVLACAAVAVAAGAHAGFDGIAKMLPWQRVLIFTTLAVFALVVANAFVRAMIPGSRPRLSTGSSLGLCTLSLLLAFALSFRDYHTSHFVSAGVACLITGLLHALPAGLLAWLLLRRGFAVNPIAAGLAAGTLAGLAGLGLLELHCVNFQAAHVLVWHTAVIPVSAALGALWGAAWHRLRRLAS